MRIPQAGDYIKTTSNRFNAEWKGKIKREEYDMVLVEWRYCGGLPTYVHTWVFKNEIKITKRIKIIK